ncbi:MTH938/NDUFAF3 family protein [Methylophaga sp.]|uniref:MTH938/NDUFAF3 family protein n=1 Tax=Methylophaga sp. TaxID=2024840 RepID=UPI003A9387A7
MKLSQEAVHEYNQIHSYTEQSVTVRHKNTQTLTSYDAAFVLTPNQILENIDVSDIKNLSADTLSALKELAPEVIIFTSDASLSFPLLQMAEYFNKQGIGTEFMSRASACHTYNLLLIEERSVILIVSP